MPADTLVIVLAGGVGERLYPLTKERAKPAVYFGGPYRIIDFTLCNCINSGFRRIFIATQYKSLSLSRHIRMGWSVFADELGEFIEILPPQKRVGEHWYLGTADAVYQNLYSITRENPKHIIVLSGDHVYKMDYARMLRFHQERGAAATIACLEVPVAEATRFGVVAVDADDRVTGFQEKPRDPIGVPGSPDVALASMGIYIFEADALYGARSGRRAPDQPRLRQGHPAGADPRRAGLRLSLPRREQEGGEVLARHRHARRLLRSEHGPLPRQPRVQPLRSRVADADLSAAGAAGEVRVRRRGPALRPGARLDHLGRLHHLGQPRRGQRAVPERARAQLLHVDAEHPDARRPRRPPLADPPRDHRPRRLHPARRAASATTRRKIASATPSPNSGIVVVTTDDEPLVGESADEASPSKASGTAAAPDRKI